MLRDYSLIMSPQLKYQQETYVDDFLDLVRQGHTHLSQLFDLDVVPRDEVDNQWFQRSRFEK